MSYKLARRNNNLRYADGTTLTAENEEERKSLLMRVKKENEKAGWKFSIEKKKTTKIIASGSISSWQIEGENVEAVSDSLFLGSKSLQMVTAAIKLEASCFLAGKLWQTYRVLFNKKADIRLLTKVHIVKLWFFQ